MNIARILYPVKVLGPGNRLGIWVCGCPRRCQGCGSPELWERRSEFEIPAAKLKNLIEKIAAARKIDGFTITGGEPLAQPEEFAGLAAYLKTVSSDILLYTGYNYEKLRRRGSKFIAAILDSVAVIIDGQYIEELNTGVILRGSENQRIVVLNQEYKTYYENYLAAARNQIQYFTTSDGVVSVGIHRRDFASEISLRINDSEGSKNNG
jgi:anaerobic ribonucleoside-triphosphate reductase activating protein